MNERDYAELASRISKNLDHLGLDSHIWGPAILAEISKDRRMGEIREERAGFKSPKTIESVKEALGDDAKLFDISQSGDKIVLRVHRGLGEDVFNRAVQRAKELGARFNSQERRWEL